MLRRVKEKPLMSQLIFTCRVHSPYQYREMNKKKIKTKLLLFPIQSGAVEPWKTVRIIRHVRYTARSYFFFIASTNLLLKPVMQL